LAEARRASIEDGELYQAPDEQDCAVFYSDSVVLGYCRIGEKWQLALKTLTYGEMGTEDEGPSYKSGSKRALLSASRSDRIKAMKLLPKLLERIKDEVSDTIQAIDDAARAVGNL
jgi:hypothetical protein